jgi:hypothetical protein
MPFAAVLLIVAFFLVGLVIFAQPVNGKRLERFAERRSIVLSDTGRTRLSAYLLRRRRLRTAGVLVAAAIGLMFSVPDNRVSFAYAPLVTGWLLGAVAAEVTQRSASQRVPLQYWWRFLPYATAGLAIAWTPTAVLLHSGGVDVQPLVLWGVGALAASSATAAAVRYATRHALSDVDDADADMQPALAISAARGLTSGGLALAVLCLGRVWASAVPGPYEDSANQFPSAALGLVAIVVLWVLIQSVPPSTKKRPWGWLAYAVILALPIAWVLPVRQAQEPPITPEQANATATVRLAAGIRMNDARRDLGLPTELELAEFADYRELLGRVDMAPAPQGTQYVMFAFDRATKAPIPNLYGQKGGAGWNGVWSVVLPAQFPWLATVVGFQDSRGFSGDLMAVFSEEPGPLRFQGIVRADQNVSFEDMQVVLMLTRESDAYVYWATQVPTSVKVLT